MRILDRYINTSILKIFFATVCIFCFMYILIDSTSKLDEFIDRKVPINIIVQFYLSYFPIILVQTSALACLIAVLLTFSGMHNNNEIIAIRSSGLSFWQITRSAIVFSLLVSAVVFWLNEAYVPQATEKAQQIKNENMILYVDRLKLANRKIHNLTFYGLMNRLYFIDIFTPSEELLEGITIIEYNEDQRITQKVVALEGRWTGINWKFYQAQVTTYGPGGANDPQKIKVYQEKLMDIKETPDDFLNQRLTVEMMNLRDLSGYIKRFSNSGATKALNNLRVDLYQKVVFPLRNFVIVIIGLPFALMIRSRKGMTFISLGIAILIGFLYYVMESLMLAFGKGGLLPPSLSASITPIAFFLTAMIMIETKF